MTYATSRRYEDSIVDQYDPLNGPYKQLVAGDTVLMNFRFDNKSVTHDYLAIRVENVDFKPELLPADPQEAAYFQSAFAMTLIDMVLGAHDLGTPYPVCQIEPELAVSFDETVRQIIGDCGEIPALDGGPSNRTFYTYETYDRYHVKPITQILKVSR